MQVRRPRPSGSVVAASAVAGAAVGHSLTYVLAVRNASLRDAILQATGHSYWPAAVATATVLGTVALLSVAAKHFRAGSASVRGSTSVGVLGLASRIAPLQVTLFLIQEVLERAAEHAPLAGLLQQHIIQIGVPAQLLVALIFAVVLRGTAEVAEAAGRALHEPAVAERRTVSYPEPRTPIFASRLVAHVGESRAPPLPVS
jgi:hypothetical protein